MRGAGCYTGRMPVARHRPPPQDRASLHVTLAELRALVTGTASPAQVEAIRLRLMLARLNPAPVPLQ